MNSGVDYKLFYEILLDLREDFHSYGRIDDSNTKLDEIVKLIMLSYYYALNNKRFSLQLVKSEAKSKYKNEKSVAKALRGMFDEAVKCKLYKNNDGTSIFGANPSLNIQPSENLFAEKVISEIEKIDFLNLISESKENNFDILNECFGHFVRENFRNNKEDAQYMTPAEITSPILDVIFDDFVSEGYFNNHKKGFIVMDPTCGVGTLIIESAKKYIDYVNDNENKPEKTISNFLENGIVGQDKVDRMVRLSKINSLLLGANSQNIYIGNSISGQSKIDEYSNKVDLIFTNPPFGAEYKINELYRDDFDSFDILEKAGTSTICSELLMLLKCLKLLKPNGKLAIVLPDSVYSAKGANELVRDYVVNNYKINGIFELPAVTFAQAGTRTKTSILYLTNCKPEKNNTICMSVCEDIGYVVKERSGVPVKIAKGINEMVKISECYIKRKNKLGIINHAPSVTVIKNQDLINGILTPNFYSASRLDTVENLVNSNKAGFEMKPLKEIVNFNTIGRKSKNVDENTKHISVLHINADCTIDFQQVFNFNPVSKGRLCYENEVLFAKINPRIPRMTVVPKKKYELVCSNEFEIMQPKEIGPYVLCMLLKTSYVNKQIENLAAGTSSSHCRIKREQLEDIKMPYPTTQKTKKLFAELNDEIESALNKKYSADTILNEQLEKLEKLL